MSDTHRTNSWLRGIPRTVWALGFVSMFMDISSEMIHSLLPVFLVTVLHSNVLYIGIIEGVAEATALITKTFSGALSDWLGKRKALAFAGYALATLTKPMFALANSVVVVFGARFLDRIGKGMRGAPRDALVADVTRVELLGAAYGLRQSLDTVGAFMGPLLAIVIMAATGGNFRTVFWVAVLPGFFSVSILAFGVSEPAGRSSNSSRKPIRYKDVFQLPTSYWMVVMFGSLFTLARFSEAFLLLRAEDVGVTASLIPGILVLMNLVFSLTAYPIGHLSDRLGRTGLMALGLAVLIVSDLVLAAAQTGWQVAAGAMLWGLHMGLTQGLLAAMVADTAQQNLRGTAFGIFSMAGGLAVLIASLVAGWLWDVLGAPATFLAGASLAAAALSGYLFLRKYLKT